MNEAKAAGEKVKEHCENKCKELENKLLYAEVYQRRENLRFYGIEEEEDENSLNVLKSFLEQQCGIQRGIPNFSESIGLENSTKMEALERLLLVSLDMATGN